MTARLTNGIIPEADVPDFIRHGTRQPIVLFEQDQAGTLLRPGKAVGTIDTHILQQARNMAATLRQETDPLTGRQRGLALAHNQIGGGSRIVVMDMARPRFESTHETVGRGLMVLINPVFFDPSADQDSVEEKCLSLPDKAVSIVRPEKGVLGFTDLAGDYVELPAAGLLARCGNHELDHLDGLTVLDRMRSGDKLAFRLMVLELQERRQLAGYPALDPNVVASLLEDEASLNSQRIHELFFQKAA